jgi:hypothetical protein
MPDNNANKRDTTNSQRQEIPLDYLLWNSLQGVPLRGKAEGGINVVKNEYQFIQAPLPAENGTIEIQEKSISDYLSTIRVCLEDNNVPMTVINDVIGTLHVTHPVTWGNYYNSKGKLSSLAHSGKWEGGHKWNNDIYFGSSNQLNKNIKHLSYHARQQIKHFQITRGFSVVSGWLGGAIYVVTLLDETGNIIDGTANYSKLAADGIFTGIGILGGPYGVAISMIYFTVDVAFEKDGEDGWERLFHPVKDVYQKMVDVISRLNNPSSWTRYISNFY